MSRRNKPNAKRSTHFLPMMAPPMTMKAGDQDWYRRASDILTVPGKYEEEDEDDEGGQPGRSKRQVWGSQLEFLMSCIATSVGLGNVWRFAFVAYQNGGGAFLIPYMIVLIFIGKPMYYLECVLGQFSSRNSVRVWSCAPAMKGTGYAQTICILYIVSYYVAIVALCLHYLVMSFSYTLPWAKCDPSWANCVPSAPSKGGKPPPANSLSSAELYFTKTVLQQKSTIHDGLGTPIWYLVLSLLAAWLIIFLIVAQGVKSSGKAAYFLAIFPYIVMIILLISTVILPGSGNGILFFITPQWGKLIELDVWYAAVTQVFFSLTVGTGPIIMFSSYNSFRANVHRDSMIVTTLDTFTSLISGFTIFGILGNLAYELKQDIRDVVGSGGTGLAFISYPDAIAKTFMPQVFSVLFFVMMVVLGIGSSVAFLSTINTVFLDAFTQVRTIYITMINCCLGFLSGIVYLTPGGQYILELVDYYGATFLALFCAICEVVGTIWIYGLENICLDLEFMLGIKTSFYWRLCWGVITPVMMILVFIYALFNFEALMFGGYYVYPLLAYVSGYILLFVGILFVPLFIIIYKCRQKGASCCEKLRKAFEPKSTWGPRNRKDRRNWLEFKADAKVYQRSLTTSKFRHICYSLTGRYRKGLATGQGGLEGQSLMKITDNTAAKTGSQGNLPVPKSKEKSMARAAETPSDSSRMEQSETSSSRPQRRRASETQMQGPRASTPRPPPGAPPGTPPSGTSPPGTPPPGSPRPGTPPPGSSRPPGTPPPEK